MGFTITKETQKELDNQKSMMSEELEPWSLFIYAMKAPMTRDRYQTRVAKFFEFVGIDGTAIEDKARNFVIKARNDSNWAFNSIMKFTYFQKQRVDRKEISGATVRNYVKSIKLFCEMADVPIQWKKITRGLPRGRKYADDRIPTLDEIRKLVEYPDRRIKAIVFTMASSGIRIGAWDYLQWGHILPIERNEKIVAAKMTVYAGDEEEYFTFITSEAWQELKKWMDYRHNSGEMINASSWVMRDLWDTRVAQGRGFVTLPKKLSSLGVKRLMERAIWAQGLRKKLEPGKKRHPYQANHSLRKWFKTRCEISGMKPINIEKLMNHSTGISDAYYRATENELLDDFLKAVDLLSINYHEKLLQKTIAELQEKTDQEQYIIKTRLQEKDEIIESMREKYDSDIALLKEAMSDMQQLLRNPKQLQKISRH